jgi:hypothetical protein
MKRSPWITAVTVIQLLLGLTLAGVSVYLLVLTKSPEILGEKDAADTVHGLHIAAAILSPLALAYFLSVLGLWKGKLWGWWIAFLLNLASAGSFVYSLIDDGWKGSDASDKALTAGSVAIVLLFIVPVVRKYYWNSRERKAATFAPEGNKV